MTKKYVKKFATFEEEQQADDDYYRNLSLDGKLQILIGLIGHTDPKDGIVERRIRIYPITQSEEG